jgi:hypothetical protein
MKYKGLVGFSTSNSFISKAIRWFRKSEFSHTFVVLDNFYDTAIIGEADTFKVRLAPLYTKVKKGSKVELWETPISEELISSGIQEIMKLTGRPYGFGQLIGFIWIWFCEKICKKQKSNPFHNGIICSEFVYYFLLLIGYKFLKMKPDNIAPDHIRKAFMKDGSSTLYAISDFDSEELIIIKKAA